MFIGILNKPIFRCWVLGHNWQETGRTWFGDGEDVYGTCLRCLSDANWNTTQGVGKPPDRPTWNEVRNEE